VNKCQQSEKTKPIKSKSL
jgi:hypothetical protein